MRKKVKPPAGARPSRVAGGKAARQAKIVENDGVLHGASGDSCEADQSSDSSGQRLVLSRDDRKAEASTDGLEEETANR